MFIPLKDLNPRRTYPVVNTLLILTNVIVFLYQLTLTPHQSDAFVLANATIPNHIRVALSGHGSLEAAFVPIFTSMFLHSGFMHIAGNMLFLWIFGDNVEVTTSATSPTFSSISLAALVLRPHTHPLQFPLLACPRSGLAVPSPASWAPTSFFIRGLAS